jgi:hypothetical protein
MERNVERRMFRWAVAGLIVAGLATSAVAAGAFKKPAHERGHYGTPTENPPEVGPQHVVTSPSHR